MPLQIKFRSMQTLLFGQMYCPGRHHSANGTNGTQPMVSQGTKHQDLFIGNERITYHTDSHRNNPNNRRCHRKFCETGTGHARNRHRCNLIRPIHHGSHSSDCIVPTPTRIHRSHSETDRHNLKVKKTYKQTTSNK